jgi:hypothetical protein
MTHWVRRVHMYLGLLNFSLLMVFGIAGLAVTFEAPDIFSQKQPPSVTYRDFTAPPSASDREVARLIGEAIQPAHAGEPVIHRNEAHQLVADFYSINGLVRATLSENDHRLSVTTFRNSIWRFFDNAHATTINERVGEPVVRAWAWYIELSIWSLVAMAISGVWLGVASRSRFRWTRVSLVAGAVVFVALYWLERR